MDGGYPGHGAGNADRRAMSLLDMTAGPSRQSTWRFDLLDPTLQNKGVLPVDRTNVPMMQVDVSRAIKRSLTSLVLPPGGIDDIDVIKDRVKVVMITADDNMEYDQGVFLFSDVSRIVLSSGVAIDVGSISMVDQLLIVDQQIDTAISFPPGKQITVAIAELLQVLPIQFTIDPSSAVISATQEAVAWPAGTSRLRIVNELGAMIGYHDLYFQNDGKGRMGLMPNPLTAPDSSVISYPVGGRTYRVSTTRSTNLLGLPNQFVVVNSGATNIPVYGKYNVPDSAPHSAANRGFVISHVEQLQGIDTNADAITAAEALAREWRFPFETVEMAGPPDPRHDHYSIVDFESVRFLELGWRLPLTEGSDMTHVLRRTYEGGTTEGTG